MIEDRRWQFSDSYCSGDSAYRDELLNEADDLFVFGSCDATDLLQNNPLLYRGDRVCPNLALHFQHSLLKISRAQT
jgi:hypothetical protein